ncbi:hypothetical protein J2Y49_006319 [Azospirillum sp. BE72]|nr:hypothetical protein [Azospirillum sp. BE72]
MPLRWSDIYCVRNAAAPPFCGRQWAGCDGSACHPRTAHAHGPAARSPRWGEGGRAPPSRATSRTTPLCLGENAGRYASDPHSMAASWPPRHTTPPDRPALSTSSHRPTRPVAIRLRRIGLWICGQGVSPCRSFGRAPARPDLSTASTGQRDYGAIPVRYGGAAGPSVPTRLRRVDPWICGQGFPHGLPSFAASVPGDARQFRPSPQPHFRQRAPSRPLGSADA